MKNKQLINSIASETELLEALDWDDDLLNELYEYLDIHFNGDSIIKPDLLLEEVNQKFGQACSKILREMFLKVSLSHGLFIHDPDVEH